MPLLVEIEDDTKRQLVLIGAQRANKVAKALRQHRYRAVDEIDRRGTLHGLTVNDTAFGDIVRDIGNMHTHLIESFVEFLDGEGIVKVFGVGRVNGASPCIAEVLSLSNVFGRDLARDLLRGLLHVLGILIRQTVLCENGAHLGIVLSSLAEHVDDLTNRVFVVFVRPLDDLHEHLVVGLSALEFFLRNKDVLREGAVLRDAEGNVAVHAQPAYEGVLGTAEDLYDLCFLDMFLAAHGRP